MLFGKTVIILESIFRVKRSNTQKLSRSDACIIHTENHGWRKEILWEGIWKILFFAWLIGKGKGSSRQLSVSQTPEMKNGKKIPWLKEPPTSEATRKQALSYKTLCFLKPHAEKVCSSKPPEVREVSINVKSILRGQVTFKSFFFPNFLPAKRSRKDPFIWASFHSEDLHSAPKVRTLNISVCILLDIFPRLNYISYLWD